MSILRLRIASADDPAIQGAASEQPRSDTDDYRLAKSNMNAPIVEATAGVATNESRWLPSPQQVNRFNKLKLFCRHLQLRQR